MSCFSALHYAASGNHIQVAETLVQWGAKRDVWDLWRRTPWAVAVLESGEPDLSRCKSLLQPCGQRQPCGRERACGVPALVLSERLRFRLSSSDPPLEPAVVAGGSGDGIDPFGLLVLTLPPPTSTPH